MHLDGSTVSGSKSVGRAEQTIYVVDDQFVLLQLATLILEQNGYSVRIFSEARSALDAYAQAPAPPALLITDFAMEGMNGLVLTESCRRLNPRQKVLMI